MNRRTFLAATGTIVPAILTGCITVPDPPSASSSTITNRTFTLTDPTGLPPPGSDPRITVNTETHSVIVEGVIEVGSIKCKKAALERVTYKPDADTLEIVVTHAKSAEHPDNNLLGSGCDDAMSTDGYQIEITVRNEFPGVVTVIEHAAPGGHPPTTRTTSKRLPDENRDNNQTTSRGFGLGSSISSTVSHE